MQMYNALLGHFRIRAFSPFARPEISLEILQAELCLYKGSKCRERSEHSSMSLCREVWQSSSKRGNIQLSGVQCREGYCSSVQFSAEKGTVALWSSVQKMHPCTMLGHFRISAFYLFAWPEVFSVTKMVLWLCGVQC